MEIKKNGGNCLTLEKFSIIFSFGVDINDLEVAKEIWQGDLPASPNMGDGCLFRPQISFTLVIYYFHLNYNLEGLFFNLMNQL